MRIFQKKYEWKINGWEEDELVETWKNRWCLCVDLFSPPYIWQPETLLNDCTLPQPPTTQEKWLRLGKPKTKESHICLIFGDVSSILIWET